jgi:hypothetical protein
MVELTQLCREVKCIMLAVQKKDLMGIVRGHGLATRDFAVEETESLNYCALTIRFRKGEQKFKIVEFPEKRNVFLTNWTCSAPGHPWVVRNLDDLSQLDIRELYDEFDRWLAHEVKPYVASGTAAESAP